MRRVPPTTSRAIHHATTRRDTSHRTLLFGSPEAVWKMHVRDFLAVVMMDSQGRSHHQEMNDESKTHLQGVLPPA